MAKNLAATLAAALAAAVDACNKHPEQFAVVLRPEDRPGLRACGDYLPGREYSVPAAEAARLLRDKGFRLVNPADAGALEQRVAREVAVAEARAKLDEAKAAEAVTNNADASPAAGN